MLIRDCLSADRGEVTLKGLGLWRHLEEDYFSRMLVADPADFVSAAVQLLRRLQKPGVLRRVLKPRRPLT